ncbi:MAG: hypothetical protein EA379_04140 [Phycisphaerales bacterium]|nr:MAG: hypothetical protein EA379_04140 [Phycisphaerales bacterium]
MAPNIFDPLIRWHYLQPRFAAWWTYVCTSFLTIVIIVFVVQSVVGRGVDPRYGAGVLGVVLIGMSMIILLRPIRARSPAARLCRRCSHVLDPDGDGESRVALAATCPSCSADLAAPHAVVRGLGVWRARVAWPLLFWGLIWLAFFVFLPE